MDSWSKLLTKYIFLSTNTCLTIIRFKDKQLLVHTNKENIKKSISWTEYINNVVTAILQATLDGYSRDLIIATWNCWIRKIFYYSLQFETTQCIKMYFWRNNLNNFPSQHSFKNTQIQGQAATCADKKSEYQQINIADRVSQQHGHGNFASNTVWVQ